MRCDELIPGLIELIPWLMRLIPWRMGKLLN